MQRASENGLLVMVADVTGKVLDENVSHIADPNKSRLDFRKSNSWLITGENAMWFVKDLHTFQLTYGTFESNEHGMRRGPEPHSSHAVVYLKTLLKEIVRKPAV